MHICKHILLLCVIYISAHSLVLAANDELDNFTLASQLKIKTLAGELKHSLMSAMKTGGPIAAINSCHMQATTITSELNLDSALQIKRTSLKIRNPNNQADPWERSVLNEFARLAATGVPVDQLVHKEQLQDHGQNKYRLMRAIPVQAPCLSCHGSKQQIPDSVQASLRTHYPNDQATGYSLGDIRGAFSVWQIIE